MTIKDITILKSITPITVLNAPNKQTIEYLAKILQEPVFNEFVDMIRTQNGLPKEGIPIKEFIGKNFFELPAMNNKLVVMAFENMAHDLCKSLGISDEFNTSIILLLLFNAFIDIDYFEGFITTPIQFILGRKNIASAMFDYSHEVGAVIIPFNVSQRTFIKWVTDKKNWANIQKQMEENLTTDPYALRLHKNTEIALEITLLKDQQGKSYFEIANELSEKYPEHKFVKDGEWVKKTYKDYKEIWNSLQNQQKDA